MIIIPAIDLKDGAVVRYTQGKLDKKVYSQDPVKSAKHWQRQGAALLHVVDLDGAFTGVAKNLPIVEEIVKNVEIPVEMGGGVRNFKTVKQLLDAGVARVVLGTRAVQDKAFLKKCFQEYKEKIIVSVDAKNGIVLIEGWQSDAHKVDVLAFIASLREIGFTQIIYTDVLKDGTLKGPNIQGIKLLLKTGMSIIASGGISSLDDIRKLKELEKQGVTGIIIGKALYEGKFTLSQAIKSAG